MKTEIETLSDRIESQASAVELNEFDSAGAHEQPVQNQSITKLTKLQFTFVYIGLLVAVFLTSLDQTILATALKAIIVDFGHQDLVPWIGSIYLLTAAPVGTLYGKFADIFGRKWVFMVAILLFEIGSLICGTANSIYALIAGRAVAGIGDRGKFQGPIGALFGLASVVGPIAGGALSDYVSWRWCFYVNLPLGLITMISVYVFLNITRTQGSIKEKLLRIDFLGVLLQMAAVVCLVTPLQLGGSVWAWNSPEVIVMFVLFLLLTGLFVYVENKVSLEPIVPPGLFVSISVPALLAISFCIGAINLSGSYYLSLFFQIVKGNSATQAGLATIPFVAGIVFTAILSGILVSKTGRYRNFLIAGPFIMGPGIILTAFLSSSSYLWQIIIYLGIFGFGLGSVLQIRVLGIQASVPKQYIAIATAVVQTLSTIGGSVAVSITGSIFNNVIVDATKDYTNLSASLEKLHAAKIDVQVTDTLKLLEILLDPQVIAHLNVSNGEALFRNASQELVMGFTQSFKIAYLSMLPYIGLVLLLSFAIKELPLPKRH